MTYLQKKIREDFIIYNPIPYAEIEDIFEKSLCILDHELPDQSGLSNRLIHALAMGKKVVTTNKYIKRTLFYDEDQIYILDRNTPIIPIEFLQKAYFPKDSVRKELGKVKNR